MKNYYIHFYSQQPCNLFVNGELVGLIDNNYNFFVDMVVYTQQLIITCEPLSDNDNIYIPLSFKLNFNDVVYTDNSNVQIIPFPKSNYDICISFKKSNTTNKHTIENKKVGNYQILALTDKYTTISIFENNSNLYTTTTEKLDSINAEKYNELLLAYSTCNSLQFLLIFNTKTNEIILSDVFNIVEKSNNKIKALKQNNQILKTAEVFELDTTSLTKNKYSVYLDNYKNISIKNLIPFAFLEAIKQKDYNLATTFLDTDTLAVDNEKLKQYFGKINSIHYNCYNLNNNYSNYTIFNPEPKNFNFYIPNDKIIEIEEVDI